jgi:hypothetical protein
MISSPTCEIKKKPLNKGLRLLTNPIIFGGVYFLA